MHMVHFLRKILLPITTKCKTIKGLKASKNYSGRTPYHMGYWRFVTRLFLTQTAKRSDFAKESMEKQNQLKVIP